MNFARCLHIVLVIGNYTDVFRGIFSSGGSGGFGYVEEYFHGEIFHGEANFMKLDFPELLKNNMKLNKK